MPRATATATFRVRRWLGGGPNGGCQGIPTYYRLGQDSPGYQAISPTELLGRDLGEGTIIQVTIEVFKDESIDGCRNPWHDQDLGLCLHKYGAGWRNMPKAKGISGQFDLAERIAAI
jgi:hypothetical protein